MPTIVVMIDNFAEMAVQIREENFDTLLENKFIPLVRSALSAGVVFVVTANIPNNLTNRLYGLFSERITFKQTDTDRYLDIVGRGAVEIGDIPGRGYIRRDRKVLLFQTALPLGHFDNVGRLKTVESDDIRLLSTHMAETLKSRGRKTAPPATLQALPQEISLSKLLQMAEANKSDKVEANKSDKVEAVVGQQINLVRYKLI